MAQQPGTATLAMPVPPAYYRKYSSTAVKDGTCPSPPVPPETYACFGHECNITQRFIQPLSDCGIEELFDKSKDRLAELKRLNRETLSEFIALTEHMSASTPEEINKKVQRLELLFTNLHHLLNEFRPHQGRETIRAMLEAQLRERDAMIANLTQTFQDTREALGKMFHNAQTQNGGAGTDHADAMDTTTS
eukprot:m.489389 g.489389  ORF g.489389 m.489389 type:complete len:191 (+) comp21766_c0_seq2:187-759(+)